MLTEGTMTINGTEYQFIMQLVQNDYEGVINAGDRQIPFTGTTQGTTVSLDMLDTMLLAGGIGFFVVAVLYVLACDRM